MGSPLSWSKQQLPRLSRSRARPWASISGVGDAVDGPKAHTTLLRRLRGSSQAVVAQEGRFAQRGQGQATIGAASCSHCQRPKDATHKAPTQLARGFGRIGIEDFERGRARNPCLARWITDGGSFEFRRQLDYRACLYGTAVVVAGRFADVHGPPRIRSFHHES